ncbi:MAG: hypothetical protein COB65_09065 [Thalassobium sp.]|nr:MAG: hypothetical protein COB65_09065 [Thalassobium sp.]
MMKGTGGFTNMRTGTATAETILDVLDGEGLADIDLDAVARLCVPLWEIPVADRQTVADLCKHP